MPVICPYFWDMKKLLFPILFVPIILWSQTNFEKGENLFHSKKYAEAQVIFEGILKISIIISSFLYDYVSKSPQRIILDSDYINRIVCGGKYQFNIWHHRKFTSLSQWYQWGKQNRGYNSVNPVVNWSQISVSYGDENRERVFKVLPFTDCFIRSASFGNYSLASTDRMLRWKR